MIKKDGHIHTPFCPHGSKDSFEDYVEKALTLGFQEITFTEHAPLPDGFLDPAPARDSAMKADELHLYFEKIAELKSLYKGKIQINAGLEVDFIEGFEEQTKNFLNKIGHQLDDAILSVHFLKKEDEYDCLDYSPDVFSEMISKYGSIQAVYKAYFNTLLLSIHADLGLYKPKRIGHITLVKKFQKKFPIQQDFNDEMDIILTAMKTKGYELDYNGAGLSKPLCKETYPPETTAKEALQRGISLVYGSDAHRIKELGQGLEIMPLLK